MNTESNKPRFSARAGFFLGVVTAAVIGALAIAAVRYDGNAKTTTPTPPAKATVAPAVTETFAIAEHVAAMSGSQDPATPATPVATAAGSPSAKITPHSVLLSGTIDLDKSAASSVTGTVTVFVIARDHQGKGHPILAKRIDVASFPAKFSLGPEDSMMGGTPPDQVSLEARIDLDHDAMTHEPGVPATKIDSVAIGSHDVTLTLKKS